MKKLLTLALVVIMALTAFVACEDNLPAKTPDSLPKSGGAVPAPQNNDRAIQSAPQNNEPSAPKAPAKEFIGEEAARGIALQRAGLSAAAVVFERTELDRDNGVWQYEVEFRQGAVEYDVDIKADDGTVLKFEKDIDD